MTLRDFWSTVNLALWLFALIAVLFNFDSIKLSSFEIKHILVMYTLRKNKITKTCGLTF